MAQLGDLNGTGRFRVSVAAREAPRQLALIFEDRGYSYADLWELVEPLLAALPDCPVALTAHARLRELLILYACLENEHPLFLMHPRWTANERDFIMSRLDEVAEYTSAGFQVACRAGGDHPEPSDQILLATSGTTGQAKLVPLSQRNLLAATQAHATNLPFLANDRWLLSLPFAHIGGLSILLRCLSARSTVVVLEPAQQNEQWPSQLEDFKITLLSLVPTQLQRLLGARAQPTHLRAVLVGGAPTPLPVRAAATALGIRAIYTYGMTEAASQICSQSLSSGADESPCSVGLPLQGVELRTNAQGQIEIRGPQVFRGYLGASEVRAEDDWFTTSDLGMIRENGAVEIQGRSDNVIISGGENVSPELIESRLLETGVIEQICVLGPIDPEWGQVVVALVVPSSAQPKWEEHCREFAKEHLATYSRPKHFFAVERLISLASGKPDRKAMLGLAKEFLKERPSSSHSPS